MGRRDDLLGMAGAQSIIGAGVKVKGNLSSEGDISIDGTLQGDIKARGSVDIGVNGIIKANIRGSHITVSGQVDGNLVAEDQVSITETGRVTGNLSCAQLSIATGAIFLGTTQMHQTLSPQLSPPDDAVTS